jgi:hypothetical protein
MLVEDGLAAVQGKQQVVKSGSASRRWTLPTSWARFMRVENSVKRASA